jgi:hypothetical protein
MSHRRGLNFPRPGRYSSLSYLSTTFIISLVNYYIDALLDRSYSTPAT